MPIYEYECKDCGHQFEAIQKMSENALTGCPQCNKPALRKLVSAVAFRLKGKGWYETDFKEGDKKNLSSNESADPADKKSDAKSDTKKNASDANNIGSDTDSKKTPADSTDTKKKAKSEKKSSSKKEKSSSSKTPANKKNR